MELRVRSLRRDDDRSTFRSGDANLDVFFAQYVGVVVDSKAGALPFYEKFGFKPRPVVTPMTDTPTPLFLKIATIKKALRSS